jgi:hypothetical protein
MNARTSSLAAALLLAGCAHSVDGPPVRVRAGQLPEGIGALDLTKRPLIIELREGDVLPLDVLVDGDLIGSPEGASIPLTAKRTFFVRVDANGLKISRDGVDFDAKSRVPGSFQLGVGVTRATGTRATLKITTPRAQ